MDMGPKEPFVTCLDCLQLSTEAFEASFVAAEYGFKNHARAFEIEGCMYQNRALYSRTCEHERKPRTYASSPELDAMIEALSA